MDLEGHTHMVYGSGYRHNYEGFHKKTIHHVYINKGRMTITQGAHTSLVRILSFLLYFSWQKDLKKRSNHLETVGILLEARHLNNLKNSLKETLYVFSYIQENRIIFLVPACFKHLIRFIVIYSMF